MDDVASKISAKTGYAVRNLYTAQGKKITAAGSIEDGGTYVATGSEKYKSAAYGIRYVNWGNCFQFLIWLEKMAFVFAMNLCASCALF